MLRTLLIATALLTASGAALARDGRVISVEPQFSISFGTRHADGFRVLYESGGHHYWAHTPYHPGPWFVPPPRHHVAPVYYAPPAYGHYKHHKRGWDGHGRHHGEGRRDHWDDDRDDRHRGRGHYRHDWD